MRTMRYVKVCGVEPYPSCKTFIPSACIFAILESFDPAAQKLAKIDSSACVCVLQKNGLTK